MATLPYKRPDIAVASNFTGKIIAIRLRPTRIVSAFFIATFVTDVILLAIDAHTTPRADQPAPSPFAFRLLAHGCIDLLSLTILWFGIRSRARTSAIEERPWFVAAIAGVIFALLLYGVTMIPMSEKKVADPGDQDSAQSGRSWPILVYFLFPLAATVATTRRKRA